MIFCIMSFIIINFSFTSCKSTSVVSKGGLQGDRLTESQEMEYYHYFIEGNKYKTLGYLNDAQNAFSKCIDINPYSGGVNYEMANIFVFQNDFSRAANYCEKAVKADPDNIWYNLLYANILNSLGDTKQSIKIYEEIIKKYPENTDLMIDLADFYSRDKKNYDKAIQLLNTVEERYGVSLELFSEKERIYKIYGIKGKILPEAKKLVEAFPDEPEYLGIYAERLMSEGQVDESYQVYLKLLDIDPDNPTTHISFGEYYLKKDSVEKGLAEFKISLGNKYLDSEIKVNLILNLSNYYGDKITKEQIEELVDILINSNPYVSEGHALKAEILISKGDLKNASEELVKVLETEKENYMIWEELISIDNELGEYNNMYNHSKEAAGYFPNYPKFLLLNGFACGRLKKYEEGLRTLEIGQDMVIQQPDLKVQFLSTLADLYYKNNNFEKAFDAFEKALEIQPANAGILNNYSYYLSLRNKNLEKAKTMAKLAVELFSDNSTYIDTYAWALYKSGNFAEAEENIAKAYSLNGFQNAVIIEHYGDILFKLGKRNEAIEKWKEAISVGNGSEFLNEKILKGDLIE